MSLTTNMSQPTPLEWEAIRPISEELYITQGRRLKDVQDHLGK